MTELSAIQPEPAASHTHKVLDEKAKARLQKATKDFEALFLSYILKGMRSGLPKDDESDGEGYGGEMMEGLIDSELSLHVSKNSNLGLAEMLYRSATGEDLPRAPSRSNARTAAHAVSLETGSTHPRKEAPLSPRPATESSTPASAVKLSPPSVHAPAGAMPRPAVPDTVELRIGSFESLIQEASEKHSVNANLLKAVIAAESAGHSDARSPRGAKGLMQLIDSTAAEMGVKNVWDPRQNILGGARYLQSMLTRFRGDLENAVASYNAGPGAVEKHGGIPPYKETRLYVDKVLTYLRHFEQLGTDDENQD